MVSEPNTPQVAGTITMNYKPAIAEGQRFMKSLTDVNNKILQLQATSAKGLFSPTVGIAQGAQQSGVILDQYGKVLSVVDRGTEGIKKSTQSATQELQKHTKSVNDLNQSYSVLGSQFERRISWFLAGAGFYGAIRGVQDAVRAFTDVESSMIIVQRTVNDLTADFGAMRDELIQAGVDFGHTWDTVQQAAIRWAQAGYEVNEIIELVRTSLLALNVAEMDIEMATQGLISIMAQWGFEVSELETVIDKLNITSDNYAVTTGDLVAGLQRSSGAARALGLEFEETVGLITAMRVASGRLGAEVGNALNTILAYITRQSTLNTLMRAGIQVYADEAKTTLRPAMELLVEISEKWGNVSQDLQVELVELADTMGVMSEEMAEMIGLQDEWTQMQQLEVEQSIAGVRRRNFLIALLRNFAQAQEVVVNMQDAEGYSMRQNIQTMETLEKQYQQLRMAATQLAVAIGEAGGLLNQMKGLVEGATDAVTWFNELDTTLQTLILTFAQVSIGMKVLSGLFKMAGISGLLTQLAATKGALGGIAAVAGGPAGVAVAGLVALFTTLEITTRRLAEEQEKNLQIASHMADEYENLIETLEKNLEGTSQHARAMEEIEELNYRIADQFPELVTGYDDTTQSIIINTEALRVMREEHEELQAAREEELEGLQRVQDEYANRQSALDEEEQRVEKSITELSQLIAKRNELVTALEQEGLASQDAQRMKEDLGKIQQWIIDIVGEEGYKRLELAGFTGEAIDFEIDKIYQKMQAVRDMKLSVLQDERDATQTVINESSRRINQMAAEIAQIQRLREERSLWQRQIIFTWQENIRYNQLLEDIQSETRSLAEAERALRELDRRIDSFDREITVGGGGGTVSPPAVNNLADSAQKAAKSASQMRTEFDMARESFERMVRYGVLSTQEQLKALEELSRFKGKTAADEFWLQEQRFQRYRDLLKEEQKLIEEAYRERLKLIDDERDAKIAALQAEIDALDEEGNLDKREEARRKHINKIAELEEKKRYHELRTGVEHERSIVDITKQIQEEYIRWEREQEDWKRQDKRDALRQEIQNVRDQAEEQKQIWQNYYDAMLEEFNDHNLNLIALAATYDERYLKDGLSKAQQWIKGFRDGSVKDMKNLLGELESMAKQFRASSFFPDLFTQHTGQTSSSKSSSSGSSSSSASRTSSASTSTSTSTSTARSISDIYDIGYRHGLNNWSPMNLSGLTSAQQRAYQDGYTAGRRARSTPHYSDFFHEGGIVSGVSGRFTKTVHELNNERLGPREVIAKLLEGEVVANPDIAIHNLRANFGGALQAMNTMSTVGIESKLDKLIMILQSVGLGKNVSIDNIIGQASFEDRTDMEIMGRELFRMMQNL